jgi:hypothetical protein
MGTAFEDLTELEERQLEELDQEIGVIELTEASADVFVHSGRSGSSKLYAAALAARRKPIVVKELRDV